MLRAAAPKRVQRAVSRAGAEPGDGAASPRRPRDGLGEGHRPAP